jgi:hypothetical protein
MVCEGGVESVKPDERAIASAKKSDAPFIGKPNATHHYVANVAWVIDGNGGVSLDVYLTFAGRLSSSVEGLGA